MRCAICDAPLPPTQPLENDLCSECGHHVRKALGQTDPIETLLKEDEE